MRARSLARLAAGLCLALSLGAHAARFEGVVTHVSDGDTLWVRPLSGGAPLKIRIDGIDAPEICQHFGAQSRNALARRVLQRHVAVTSSARDSYERMLGRINVDREDLGAWMVAHGYAWSYRFRGRSGPYAQQEAKARASHLGLWAEARPEPPRDFRKRHGSCHLAQ